MSDLSTLTQKPILVTGAAGFIGFHVAKKLLQAGHKLVGFDNLTDYYDPALKQARLAQLSPEERFHFVQEDLCDARALNQVFERHDVELVIHLAAQPGVRYSLENPRAYIDSNIIGFLNILECCRHHKAKHLVYASSSSVYGGNEKLPFSEHDPVDHPVSLYAATKKSNELMAHTYAHLYALPCTGLRFFTVYGPWGRPDMAVYKFTKAIFEGRPIEVFNHGKMKRDFTYIDDIVEGVIQLAAQPPQPQSNWDRQSCDPATSFAPYRVFNIGNDQPVALARFIELLEKYIGRSANKQMREMQAGDIEATWANIDDLMQVVGFRPKTPIEQGLFHFVEWYRQYHEDSSK